MSEVLFIALFPTSKNIQDGMMQRIKNIDLNFSKCNRCYLYISLNPFRTFTTFRTENGVDIYSLKMFGNYKKIISLIKESKIIYIHSIYNYFKMIPFIYWFKKKKIILDVHGAVPEELHYYNHKFQSRIYDFIEKLAFRKVNVLIFVTKAMEEYYLKKYTWINNKLIIVYPIISKNSLFHEVTLEKPSDKVLFIYSGNTQKWQGIDKILNFIKENHSKPNHVFYILTQDVDGFNNKLDKMSLLNNNNIIVKKCTPEELYKYYSISNYGFMIREDHILNRVANPTKMLEYLYYGIIPIVDLVEIGDYATYQYEYIKYYDKSYEFQSKKSSKNKEIAKEIIEKNKAMDENIVRILTET